MDANVREQVALVLTSTCALDTVFFRTTLYGTPERNDVQCGEKTFREWVWNVA